MFKPSFDLATFVCLTDVYDPYTEFNPVIYNIRLSDEENTKVIREITEEYFNIVLTNETIKKLITLEPKDFVTEYRSLVA